MNQENFSAENLKDILDAAMVTRTRIEGAIFQLLASQLYISEYLD